MIPSYTARERRGMNRSQEGHMRVHFKQRDISSSSLEGMERPVRSFEAFVQTSPPNPSETDKALPLTPAPWNRAKSDGERIPTPPSAGLPLASREINSSIASWRAPSEWYNESASSKPTHSTPSPSLTPPTSAPRTFSPLLPEPFPGLLRMAKTTAWLNPVSPPASRLLPIYERTNASPDLDPPRCPPRSPLPATPPLNNRYIGKILPPEHRRAKSPSKDLAATDRVQELSRSGPNNEKAYASLGLGSPLPNNSYESELNQRGRKRADRQYLREKKLRALYKGSPLHDDSWEDEDMDDKTRELSFSQDYHDILADQYQEMNVRAQEVLSTGGVQQVHEAQLAEPTRNALPNERDVIPRPLSWRKSSGLSTPRSLSFDGNGEPIPSPWNKSRHKRISSFISHRLGSLESNKEGLSKKERRPSESKRTPDPDEVKAQDDDLRISRFLPSTRPIKFGKKHRNIGVVKAPSVPSPPSQPNRLIRLPGGHAVMRTHSPSPVPKSDISPTSTHTCENSQCGSEYSPTTSNPRSSYYGNNSPSTANIPITMRSAYCTSGGSSSSHRSSSGHQIAQEATPPPPPPPPPIVPYSPPQSPPRSPETLNRLRDENNNAEHRYRPNFLEKAKEARRRRLTEARQDKLKKSIKVLGPTDPGVVQAGYVKSETRFQRSTSDLKGRLPGYLMGGSA
ncbi:hypothetical protein P171DRAFT_445993 [Karstenula rhodostoma CBS 690.94]|uniref:Uncharacterized protein n=1 Tax=Karstenula rhodostoma CBS 690.94 TaxID=1392251 RepID=A0A9P4PFL7_9PLEO|nr:hypothetical protein P171DRAFT_445993 [Karstenula rhodostoma CBS 690.94]